MGLGLLEFGPFWESSVTPLQVCQGWELRQGWHKAVLAPFSHSIPAKEEVPIPERAPGITLSSLFPLPRTNTPAPTPPALPSKATLPFVPEFGEYKGGLSSLPLLQIFPWDIWLPIHQHPSHRCCAFLLVSLFLCPCCGLFLLYPLSCLLGLKCQGCKTWAGGI